MKLCNDQICTTTEVLKEFFAMSDRLIYSIPEKRRYEKIYKYLSQAAKRGSALSLGKLKINDKECYRFKFEGELYVIPLKFIEREELTDKENTDEKVVISFK